MALDDPRQELVGSEIFMRAQVNRIVQDLGFYSLSAATRQTAVFWLTQ